MTDSGVALNDLSLVSARNVSLTYRVPEAEGGLVGAMTVAGQVDMNYYFAVYSYCYSQWVVNQYNSMYMWSWWYYGRPIWQANVFPSIRDSLGTDTSTLTYTTANALEWRLLHAAEHSYIAINSKVTHDIVNRRFAAIVNRRLDQATPSFTPTAESTTSPALAPTNDLICFTDHEIGASTSGSLWDAHGSWKFDDGRYALLARETESQFNFSAKGFCTGDNHQW